MHAPNIHMMYVRPVVLYFNRYEMSNINTLDGNKIYIGDNDEFLLALFVGAGIKENDNSFTGIIIGQRNFDDGGSLASSQVRLFGCIKGSYSIFMNSKTGSSVLVLQEQAGK